MLTDEQQFEVNEIFNYFDDENELDERIAEAIGLIEDDQNSSNA